jgi:dihydrolipoamide dehydrogenase
MKYDAIIIGAGPGGYECALHIARLGGKVVVIEKGELGGVCTNRGCIPTKALIASAEAFESVKRAAEYGFETATVKANPELLFKRRDRVALTLRKGVEKLLADAKVEVVKGEARVKSADTVEAAGRVFQGRNIVIATGSLPAGLPNIPLDGEFVLSGDDAAASSKLPGRVVIIGGGFIGCEYASLYSRLGCAVTLIEALPRLLSTEDEEISSALEKALSKDVKIMTDTRVDSVDKTKRLVIAGKMEIPADMVLLAVGRKAVLPEGIASLGVQLDRGWVKVDSKMRTTAPNVYAIGDVACGLKLAHVAYEGAKVASHNIMGKEMDADFEAVPWCVFSAPEIARVGLTEKEAKQPVRIGRSEYIANGKARCMGERQGFCKVVAKEATGEILGVHIIGAHASDLIGEAALAVRNMLTLSDVIGTIHPHPTLPEIFKQACENANG